MFIIIKNNALCNCSFPNIIHAKNGENFLHCKADLNNKAFLNKLEFSSFYTCNTIFFRTRMKILESQINFISNQLFLRVCIFFVQKQKIKKFIYILAK
jgi:hypothetical protein